MTVRYVDVWSEPDAPLRAEPPQGFEVALNAGEQVVSVESIDDALEFGGARVWIVGP